MVADKKGGLKQFGDFETIPMDRLAYIFSHNIITAIDSSFALEYW
jgi:hypothetical protein